MEFLLRRLISKPLAGILGVVQVVIPLVREVLMAATRICILIPGDNDDKVVAKIKEIFDKIESAYEKFKNIFL